MNTIDEIPRPRSGAAIVAACVLALAIGPTVSAQQPPPPVGKYVGAVLVSDSADAASAFYSALFGWDMERAEDGGYAVHHKGRMIAGISPLQNAREEIEESFWLVGLAVDSLDRVLGAARESGGTIYENAARVSDYGRFAVIADRQKAPLLLIETGLKPIGGTTGPGSWVWAELWTDDVEDAADFYGDVIGLGYARHDRSGETYDVLTSKGEARVGIVTIPEEYENVEPGWAPYVAVEDLAATLQEVTRLGGTVVFNAGEHPSQGTVALIRDPSGAVLFLFQIGSQQEASR